MKQLYKGRYLVVCYDCKGNIREVLSSIPPEKQSYISNVFNGRFNNKNIEFIDVFEKHDDCFAEEDKLFLEFLKEQNICCYRDKTEKVKLQKKKHHEANVRWKRKKIIEQYEEKRVAL